MNAITCQAAELINEEMIAVVETQESEVVALDLQSMQWVGGGYAVLFG
jgi:hypothetical protein